MHSAFYSLITQLAITQFLTKRYVLKMHSPNRLSIGFPVLPPLWKLYKNKTPPLYSVIIKIQARSFCTKLCQSVCPKFLQMCRIFYKWITHTQSFIMPLHYLFDNKFLICTTLLYSFIFLIFVKRDNTSYRSRCMTQKP